MAWSGAPIAAEEMSGMFAKIMGKASHKSDEHKEHKEHKEKEHKEHKKKESKSPKDRRKELAAAEAHEEKHGASGDSSPSHMALSASQQDLTQTATEAPRRRSSEGGRMSPAVSVVFLCPIRARVHSHH